MQSRLIRLSIVCAIYLLLQFVVPFGRLALYPVTLFVVYLHELGHSFFAVATGGSVHGIQVSADGSGHALIAGGWWPLVLSGGYIGSAIFGNAIIYIALVRERWNVYLAVFFMAAMLLTAVFLYQSVESSIILFIFATAMFVLVRYFPRALPNANLFLGAASVCYVLQDFMGGPASDLQRFGAHIPFVPVVVWAVLWLAAAGYITYRNVRHCILRS